MYLKFFIVAVCFALGSVTASSFGSELWATNSGSGSSIDLNQIDITTGAVISTKRVASGLASASVDDLASDPIREPSVLWGVRWSAFVNQLVAIDPYQNTLLSSIQLNSPTPIHSLAIDPTTGVLYGAGGTSLYRIERQSGTTTLIGAGSTSLDRSLGFDAAGNLFGIAANNDLLAVDKHTGASNVVATLSTSMVDIAARPENGMLYGLGGIYNLYKLDLATGALTTIGPSLSRPSSLGFTSIPEPTSLALVLAAIYATVLRRSPILQVLRQAANEYRVTAASIAHVLQTRIK